MSANAPARIINVANRYRARKDRPKSYRFSGIAGDAKHSFGYHVDPRELPRGDYSLQTRRDRRGAKANPRDASAWDQSYNPRDMITVTKRLLAADKARDPRMAALREFCGTLDGRRTYPWDCSVHASEGINSWDDSHLWHVHASLYRDASEAQIGLLLDVLCGVKMTVPQKARAVGSKVKHVVAPKAPKWPLPGGHVFGPLTGPANVHGGATRGEQTQVRLIQRALQKAGAAPRRATWADGTWGKGTTTAMKRWQKTTKRRITGVCGPTDWKALIR